MMIRNTWEKAGMIADYYCVPNLRQTIEYVLVARDEEIISLLQGSVAVNVNELIQTIRDSHSQTLRAPSGSSTS